MVRTSVSVVDGDPSVSSCVVGFDDVRWTSTTPSSDDEHDLVWDPRSGDWIVHVDLLALLHVQIVEELESLDYDRLTLVVVMYKRMLLSEMKTIRPL